MFFYEVITGFVISCLFFFSTSSFSKSKEAPVEAPPKLVKMYKVGSSKAKSNNAYPAVINADSKVSLSFPVSGTVISLPVKEADAVKKDQIIAQMDQATFKSQLNAAKTNYTTAKTDFDRAKRLIKQNAISKKDYDKRKTEMTKAVDAFEAAKKALDDSTLRAPFDGVISSIQIDNNQTVQATQAVASVISEGRMIATANIPSRLVAKSKQNGKAKFMVALDAAPNQMIEAVIDEASLEADAVTQTYEVSFAFMPPENLRVFPGMNAQVYLDVNTGAAEAGALVSVPIQSVLSQGDKKYVWVVDQKTMRVKKTEITIRKDIGKNIQVTKGLKSGDIVVGAGASYLSDNMKVKAWSRARKN